MYVRVPLHRCTSMYIGGGQVLFQNLFLTYSPPILGRSDDEICAYNTNLATAYNHGHPRPKYTSVYILGLQVCKANLLLRRTSGIRAASEQTFRKPFEIDDADARSVQKTPAGVLVVRRGLFFVKRQRRCVVYLKRTD